MPSLGSYRVKEGPPLGALVLGFSRMGGCTGQPLQNQVCIVGVQLSSHFFIFLQRFVNASFVLVSRLCMFKCFISI